MASSSVFLVASLLLAADPTPDQIDKQIANSPGSQMPAVQNAMKKMHDYSDMMKQAEGMKKNKPKTCEQKCDMMDTESATVADHETTLPNGKTLKDSSRDKVKKMSKEMAKVCHESCEKKGRIDPEYMKEHMPKAPGAPNGWQAGMGPSGGGG